MKHVLKKDLFEANRRDKQNDYTSNNNDKK